jgi:hypothetical protein
MFLRLSLLDEYRGRVEQALHYSATTRTADPFVTRNLNLELGHLLFHMEKARLASLARCRVDGSTVRRFALRDSYCSTAHANAEYQRRRNAP